MDDLTKYEIARLLGARSLQLSYGAPPLIKVDNDMTFIDVAKKEIEKDVIPLTVLREKEN